MSASKIQVHFHKVPVGSVFFDREWSYRDGWSHVQYTKVTKSLGTKPPGDGRYFFAPYRKVWIFS